MDISDRLSELIRRIERTEPSGRRSLIAVAGPPASGKSHLARDLVEALNARDGAAVLVPMDGFHLDNGILEARGLLPRKGAPETFDGAGFVHAMARLKTEEEVILPTFDRARDISIAGAVAIGPEHRIAVVEGNYLCFREAPWDGLAALWDLSVFLDVEEAVLRERLIQRWLTFDHTPEQAEARAMSNDIPNARRISATSGGYDILF